MGLPSGIFTHELPGRLQVTFQGQFHAEGPSWPSTDVRDTAWDIVLRCFVGEAPDRETAMLGPTCVIERQYPGGFAEVPVGMEYVDHYFGGYGEMSFTKLGITVRFDAYVEV